MENIQKISLKNIREIGNIDIYKNNSKKTLEINTNNSYLNNVFKYSGINRFKKKLYEQPENKLVQIISDFFNIGTINYINSLYIKLKVDDPLLDYNSKSLSSILEMAKFPKNESKLPVDIFIDTEGLWMKTGHGNRIKFWPTYDTHTNTRGMIPMTVSSSPEIPKQFTNYVKLNIHDIETLKKFIILNQKILMRISLDKEYTLDMFKKDMILP